MIWVLVALAAYVAVGGCVAARLSAVFEDIVARTETDPASCSADVVRLRRYWLAFEVTALLAWPVLLLVADWWVREQSR